MLKQIPNVITSLNLLSGSVAVMFALSGDLVSAAFFAFAGIFFDFFDGLAARLLKAESAVGLELDSLADMVTSGLVPGVIMVQMISKAVSGDYFVITEIFADNAWNNAGSYIPLVGLLITVASAYRLAKFNVDTRQTLGFIGLPTPANTLLILSLPLILHFQYSDALKDLILNKWVLVGLTVLSSILLNAEIRLFGLKFKNWDFKSNAKRYIFLLISLILLIVFQFLAIPMVILIYIVMSFLWKENLVTQ
ncbi:CDP-alcohol phosphatidyltransferase family protein [Aureisphaera galaxeae]|uniref:CDP-alcohol phosphatidyltransferase family protein n=1 Tax=Aureisphaera galaxeae TaxID=1538023 RepID=UPI00235023B6|nr:CDP-alcohol phosphatidyltransferase family protein [Aureisphaera galaxeae]MDC8006315.1 CDP-alcohol phosphatidyltransferase family protein [Aureisphaera galaxeae]